LSGVVSCLCWGSSIPSILNSLSMCR
jgi:hypothetical protein